MIIRLNWKIDCCQNYGYYQRNHTDNCQINILGLESIRGPNRAANDIEQKIFERDTLDSLNLLVFLLSPYSKISRKRSNSKQNCRNFSCSREKVKDFLLSLLFVLWSFNLSNLRVDQICGLICNRLKLESVLGSSLDNFNCCIRGNLHSCIMCCFFVKVWILSGLGLICKIKTNCSNRCNCDWLYLFVSSHQFWSLECN